jgi:hypothetical protein
MNDQNRIGVYPVLSVKSVVLGSDCGAWFSPCQCARTALKKSVTPKNMAHFALTRPQAVVTAVNLLWLALLIGFMLAINPSSIPVSSSHHLDVFSRLVIQVVFAAIFFMIWRRRKWARTALFIVVFFGTPAQKT